MNIKCTIIVEAWPRHILVTGCEVGIFLFTQTMPAIRLYPVQVFVSYKIGIPRRLGWCNLVLVFQEQVGVFIQSNPVQMHLKTCHEILVLELIGYSCGRQSVGSIHYQLKLPVQPYLEIFMWEGVW